MEKKESKKTLLEIIKAGLPFSLTINNPVYEKKHTGAKIIGTVRYFFDRETDKSDDIHERYRMLTQYGGILTVTQKVPYNDHVVWIEQGEHCVFFTAEEIQTQKTVQVVLAFKENISVNEVGHCDVTLNLT